MTLQSGLAAHFRQPHGPSVPGTLWRVRIEHGGRLHQVRAKARLAPDATRATRRDTAYPAQTTLQYLAAEIDNGRDPAHEREHILRIGNPHGAQRPHADRPWWRFW